MVTTSKEQEPRCVELPLDARAAHDFGVSLESAVAKLHEASRVSRDQGKTVVVTGPGGQLLASVNGESLRVYAALSSKPLIDPVGIIDVEDEESGR